MTASWLLQGCLLVLISATLWSALADDSQPSSWRGHMMPLGAASTRLPVRTLETFPSPIEFFKNYVYPSVPVVFKHGAKRSAAFEKWNDEYLKSLPKAQEQITVEIRKVENRTMPPTSMTFAEFLDRYEVYDEYLVTGVPEFLKTDVLIPPPLNCDNITATMVDAVIWFSSGGTKSVLHNDDVDNINCLFRGQKELLFANYTKYRHQIVFDHPEGSYSGVDVEKVDFEKYPEFKDVEFFEAKMEAGDCIYIPYKWFHQVNSHHSNIAVNVWWNHLANIIPTPETCGSPNPSLSLADVSFSAQQEDKTEAHKDFKEELQFFEDPIESLKVFFTNGEAESYTEEQFFELLSTKMFTLQGGAWTREALDIGHEMFELVDNDNDGLLTQEDVEILMQQQEDGSFYIEMGHRFIMLIDVVDEVLAKRKATIQQKLLEASETGKSAAKSPPSEEQESSPDSNQEGAIHNDEL
ncbi:tRNA wybutosine-synthesizing protein 5-like [Asterias amurensis]|uniref:tRNA wybutosine-synthesizing protein 5-like n=1 Tax=Asterias amurensis TaxID=7602 RepID=UPI003AB5E5A0